jgi:hypothetical protein
MQIQKNILENSLSYIEIPVGKTYNELGFEAPNTSIKFKHSFSF